MADRGKIESPEDDAARGEPTPQAADLRAVAAGLSNLPGPVDFAGVLAIADSLPVMIAYLDRDLRYRFLNRTLADWLEQPRRSVLGRTMAEVVGEKAYKFRRPMVEAALEGDEQWFIADFDHVTRGKLTVQAHYVPHRNSKGKVVGIILVIQDVTEQRANEIALRESEARFRRIADSAPVMMWVTRLDRTRDFVNEAYCAFAGLKPEEINTHNWREWIHPDDWDRIVEESVAGEASLKPFTLEARFRRADGEYRWLRSVSQPRFGPDGEPIGFIGVATDITVAKEGEIELLQQVDERSKELIETQDQLRQSQKMEALGQLTGGIAHDFNNLLTVVVGGLDLIAKQVQDERLLRFATNALSAAERGARLTSQLLAFSRVQRLEVRATYVAPL
ncbi:MAG TPA: PAS domain-containing protein, partial [Sphingomicrobium sp.]|nr:PAS domain-containing protein [Sphingomicrobium sp.]